MLAENLKARRLKKGLTEKQLAEITGITERNIRYIESGLKNNPTLNTLQRLSEALNITIEKLIK